ncbi:hypothetical protein CUCO_83 [Mycobacterium phage Cuco]|uniref:Uncharacterized protein n=1 Tax=Mycobacterium phage Cuco TaxID=2922992 RepID=G1JUQ8_9CAUD|nr:hypothetical protein FGG35_gp10 [Mycobacterium phage Cuco]AEL17685.1 hypothetical protein CUCO_83 [Mycobacterium phage Cuco]AVR76663.1 hypothetical protein SEA_COOG_81 [Mycobacterium phage Coog]AVR77208.1 hypothetical protein SEA_MIDAS2_81 [Mycobacterium phage Midas2]
MARHLLKHDFANSPGVRFLTINGELVCSGELDVIAEVGRTINVGDTWD